MGGGVLEDQGSALPHTPAQPDECGRLDLGAHHGVRNLVRAAGSLACQSGQSKCQSLLLASFLPQNQVLPQQPEGATGRGLSGLGQRATRAPGWLAGSALKPHLHHSFTKVLIEHLLYARHMFLIMKYFSRRSTTLPPGPQLLSSWSLHGAGEEENGTKHK